LHSQQPVILDGAMGTLLIASGLQPGSAPELWNVEQPEKVRAVHRSYIEAGSQIILTNSFGGTRFRLARHGLEDRVHELNRAAAQIARAAAGAAGKTVLVAGSMGPTGEMLQPLGTLSVDDARQAFAAQAAALAEGGVDIFWIETMSDLNEVTAAIEGAQQAADLPVAVTMSFDTHGRTMMGVSPEKMVSALRSYNLAIIGANCGNGPDELEAAIQALRAAAPEAALIAKANAGMPKMVGGQVTYDGTPGVMADYALRVRELGARFIGGCCGSAPEHIRAMREALQSPGASS